jgi:hypothetical protein
MQAIQIPLELLEARPLLVSEELVFDVPEHLLGPLA